MLSNLERASLGASRVRGGCIPAPRPKMLQTSYTEDTVIIFAMTRNEYRSIFVLIYDPMKAVSYNPIMIE